MEHDNEKVTLKEITPIKINFNPEIGTLILGIAHEDVDLFGLQEKASELGLAQRSNYHITIIGYSKGKELVGYLNTLTEDERSEKLKRITDIINSADWKVCLRQERFQIEREKDVPDPADSSKTVKEKRVSLIQLASVPNAQSFYEEMAQETGVSFESPLMHITLFSGSNIPENMTRGIGIDREEDLEKFNPKPL